MIEQKYLSAIEQVFEEDPGAISKDDVLEDLGWDSITFMSFVAIMDEKFGIVISPTDLAQCVDVKDLIALASKYRKK
jgi:acyl carrier protein